MKQLNLSELANDVIEDKAQLNLEIANGATGKEIQRSASGVRIPRNGALEGAYGRSLSPRPSLDIRPRLRYIGHRISLNYRTAAGDPGCPGRVRFPRAGGRHLRSRAANGKTPGRHYDRSATLSLDWDRGRRITPADNYVPGSAFWS